MAADENKPQIFLQWKGTDACFDFYCECGRQGHFDGDFAYFIRCSACGALYENPSLLALKRIDATPGRAEAVEPEMEATPDDGYDSATSEDETA